MQQINLSSEVTTFYPFLKREIENILKLYKV